MELKLESKPRTDDKGNNKKKQLTELLLSFIEDSKLVIDEGGNPYLVTPDRGVSDCGTKEFSDYIILRYHNATICDRGRFCLVAWHYDGEKQNQDLPYTN